MNGVHPKNRKSFDKRVKSLERAREVLRAITSGHRDPYEGYREIYGIYLDASGMVDELKPLFRLPDIHPDGPIRVDDKFRQTILAAANDWLQCNPG